jgi:Colicin-E5 Imm protein
MTVILNGSERIMTVDRTKLYETAADFFDLSGSAIMELTPAAAIDVCKKAATRRLIVLGVEGGIRNNARFEARLDCIWDGLGTQLDQAKADENNLKAAEFIKKRGGEHNAFIVTVAPIAGDQRHKSEHE